MVNNRMTQEEKTQVFESALLETGKPGIEKVIAFLKQTDFYQAPATMVISGNYPGGLLDHTLNTAITAMALYDFVKETSPETNLNEISVETVALLHNIALVGCYVPTVKNRKNASGEWESYTGYTIQASFPAGGAGEKSVIMLCKIGLANALTAEELLAIRWQNGQREVGAREDALRGSFETSIETFPLISLLSCAIELSRKTLDKKNKV